MGETSETRLTEQSRIWKFGAMRRSGAGESKVVDLAEEREIRQFLFQLCDERDLVGGLQNIYVNLRMQEAVRNARAALECEPFRTANCEFAE